MTSRASSTAFALVVESKLGLLPFSMIFFSFSPFRLVIAKQKNVSEAARELSVNVGDILEVILVLYLRINLSNAWFFCK